ncbi:hypothetical protein BCF59_0152 [Mycoplasmopsis mustelae]|uniref:Uncharacterized protein n=1 Tax=Mycoplasmopsis mustelae TaxID=171289 RepID=A0A4R7UCN8_9BACT|nr:hypothetical protein [Mycoplasmopsis mustelae]TDV24202.1 hypothetical protein BCF59_0152 [Mycoplasmopsis mustelae]
MKNLLFKLGEPIDGVVGLANVVVQTHEPRGYKEVDSKFYLVWEKFKEVIHVNLKEALGRFSKISSFVRRLKKVLFKKQLLTKTKQQLHKIGLTKVFNPRINDWYIRKLPNKIKWDNLG